MTPEKVSLGIPDCRRWTSVGKDYEIAPYLPLPTPSTAIAWRWFPDFTASVPGLLVFAATLLAVASVTMFVLIPNGARWIGIMFLLFISFPLYFVAYRIHVNFSLRESLCYAAGKQVQARHVWAVNPVLGEEKRVFHEEKTAGGHMVVLMDGSTECRAYAGHVNRHGIPVINNIVDVGATAANAIAAQASAGGEESGQSPSISISLSA